MMSHEICSAVLTCLLWVACFVATHRGRDAESESLMRAVCNLLMLHVGAAYEWIAHKGFYLAAMIVLPTALRHVLASVLAFNAWVFVPHHVIVLVLGCTPLLTRHYLFFVPLGLATRAVESVVQCASGPAQGGLARWQC